MLNKKIFSDIDNCNLCSHNKFEKIADKLRDTNKYKVYKCLSCSHIQLLPRPRIDEERKFYDEDMQEKSIRKKVDLENLRASFRYDIHRRAEFISSIFSKEITILDVGCGYGFFLKELTQRGYKIRGIEISRERRELAKTITNVPIFDINLAEPDMKIELGQFDMVTLFHVLEHIANPIEFCRNVRKLLRKNGCLIVEVPNVDELMLETCPAYNEFYWNRAHLNYFSRKTLAAVLEKAGFGKVEVMFVQRYGIENLRSWLVTGKPQLEKPVFEMSGPYKWLEDHYRKRLEEMGRTDTLFVTAHTEV